MARRRRNSDGSVAIGLLLGSVFLFALIPREVWIVLAGSVALWLAIRGYQRLFGSNEPSKSEPSLAELTRPTVLEPTAAQRQRAQEVVKRAQAARSRGGYVYAAPEMTLDTTERALAPSGPQSSEATHGMPLPVGPARRVEPEFHEATLRTRNPAPTAATSPSRSIPPPPAKVAVEDQWISSKQVVKLGGMTIPGGLFYVGQALTAPSGGIDPCLINLHRNVAPEGDFRVRQTDYWPSYSEISPTARRAYLNWLADGRQAPGCDLGFVFLFFYGLERRVLVDGRNGVDIREDLPAIASELRRLIGLYGKSGSFHHYANNLLDWIVASDLSERLYERPLPSFASSYGLPLHLRVALGQASRDRAPIPAPLALQWARTDPNVRLRTAARRCMEVFDRLFLETYSSLHGTGIILKQNRTRLKFVYQPASSGFRHVGPISMEFGGIPDVAVLKAPVQALQEIADACADQLAAYSRMVGRDPDAEASLDGLVCLPPQLWPLQAQTRIAAIGDGLGAGPQTRAIDALVHAIDPNADGDLRKDRVFGVAKALAALGIGMEPDVLQGAKAPKSGEPVVLFRLSGSEDAAVPDAYRVAVLALQIASAVARADGDMAADEIAHLDTGIERWAGLSPGHRLRLRAHVQWLRSCPVTLAGLKKKIGALDGTARNTIARFTVAMAQADGVIAPKEIAFLEKVYKALGVDPGHVASDIHAVGTGRRASESAPDAGFRLDSARIAALRRDTEKVSALLADIFVEEPVPVADVDDGEDLADDDPGAPQLLGLDSTHAAFVRLLLSRPQWVRSELEDAAADMGLMLDGTLEVVNEAAFDAHDEALIEGDDPMDVNMRIKEALEA